MAGNPRIPVLELDDESWAELAQVIGQFEQSWKTSPGVEIDRFVPAADHRLRERILVELIKSDQEFRWQRGEQRRLEEYLSRWSGLDARPELVLELVEAECLTRAVLGEPVGGDELQSRFPDLADRVDLAQIGREAKSERGGFHPTAFHSPRLDTPTRDLEQTPSAAVDKHILKSGERFGRYEVHELLGRGGMGTVYRVFDTNLHREVALKIPRFDPMSDPEAVARFVREARTAAGIRHPNVCPVYDAGEIDGTYFITMALIKGRSLDEWAAGRVVDPHEAAELIRKLASALQRAHDAGIIHRDIKGSNVMIDESGEPLLMDFGLARPANLNGLQTSSGLLLGTPPYMSPEQIDGNVPDARSDVYSLGVLFYQLLTGRLPYEERKIPQLFLKIAEGKPHRPCALRAEINADLEAICLRAMAKAPEDRFGTARGLAESLESHCQRVPATTARRVSRGRTGWRRVASGVSFAEMVRLLKRVGRRASGRWLGLAAAAVLLACTVLFFKTGRGTLELEVPEGATVLIDGGAVDVQSNHATVRLSVDEHNVKVSKDGHETAQRQIVIRWRGQTLTGAIDLKPVPLPPGPAPKILSPPSEEKLVFLPQVERWIQTPRGVPGAVCVVASRFLLAGGSTAESPILVGDFASETLRPIDFSTPPDFQHDHFGVALSGDGRYVYLTNYHYAHLTRVDLENGNAVTNLQLGGVTGAVWAQAIGITPDQQKLVVCLGQDGRSEDLNNDQVSMVDLRNGEMSLIAEVPLDDEPRNRNLGFSSDSKFMYLVTHPRKSKSPTLCEIRLTPPFEVSRTLSFPDAGLQGMAASSKHGRIFVSDSAHRKIHTVRLDSFRVVSEIDLLGHVPGPLAISHDERLLVASCPETKKLVCLDASSGALLGGASGLDPGTRDVVFSGDDRHVLIHFGDRGRLAIVDVAHLLNRILFASDREGESHRIYAMAMDRRQLLRLTENHSTNRSPRWSPDGRKIAFVSNRSGPYRVCLVGRGGGEVTVLEGTDPMVRGDFGCPLTWSPDGRRIAFVGNEHKAIRVIDVQTHKVQTLLDGPIESGYSHYSGLDWRRSDGEGEIVLSAGSPASAYTQSLFLLDPGTQEATRITDPRGSSACFERPACSPDGAWIAAAGIAGADPHSPTVFLLRSDGAKVTQLTKEKELDCITPAWFPDGETIVYSARKQGRYRLYVVRKDGSGLTQFSGGPFDDLEPDVSPRNNGCSLTEMNSNANALFSPDEEPSGEH